MAAARTNGTVNGSVGPHAREERVGLALAVALHAAILAALLFSRHAPPPKPPERVVVTLSNDVGLTSTSPNPSARSAADVAPTIGEAPPAPAEPEPEPAPPQPVQEAAPPPPPRPVPVRQARAEPEPAPVPAPAPKPRPVTPHKVAPAPAKPEKPQKATPAPTPARPEKPQKSAAASAPARHADAAPAKPAKRAGGQRIGADFLKGLGADPGTSHDTPAAAIGPGVVASLASAVSRQIKPNWNAPDGVDVDKLATTIEWDLNQDGTLKGAPRFVSQTGVNGSNRAQAQRHIEQAMRAVRVSAPYQLPPKYYAAWKRVRFTFDWKLDQ